VLRQEAGGEVVDAAGLEPGRWHHYRDSAQGLWSVPPRMLP